MQLLLRLLLSAFLIAFACADHQFITPEGYEERVSGAVAPAYDRKAKWMPGDRIQIEWNANFPSMTLQLLQPDYDGVIHRKEYFANRKNDGNLTYTWIVEFVIESGREREMNFVLFDSSDPDRFIESKNFRIYDRTEVTINPLPQPQPSPTVSTKSGTKIDSSSLSNEDDEKTQEECQATLNESIVKEYELALKNARDETFRVGLAVGLGFGLPLVVLCVLILYFHLKIHRKSSVVVNEVFAIKSQESVVTAEMAGGYVWR